MPNRRHILAGITATLATPAFAAGPVQVVATTGMIADLVSRIGGEHVRVKGLMGPGVDPHAYRLTRSDIVDMTRADLVFWHGLYLEAQIESFMETLTGRVPTKAVADSLATTHLLAHEDYDGRYDPHVWMDPKLWAECVAAVVETLSLARPEVKSIFEANAERFIADAMALEGYSREILMQVPEEQRVLVTAHDAFGYFGRAYGFDVQGIQGISTESEAGLNRVKELVDMIVSRNLRAVFVETSVSDRSVRALVEGAEAQGHTMAIGGALFSDAMGQPGTYEGTWLGMIDHNVTTIAQAMGANAPERGRLGQLGF